VLKQYNKSIFIDENKFLFKKIIYKLNNIFFSSDLYLDLEFLIFNLYNLFRMFIKKDMWKIEKTRKNLTSKCSILSYPKNVISFTGDYHAKWFNYFIKIYFNDHFRDYRNKDELTSFTMRILIFDIDRLYNNLDSELKLLNLKQINAQTLHIIDGFHEDNITNAFFLDDYLEGKKYNRKIKFEKLPFMDLIKKYFEI
jgi:hypothetical protein